MSTHEMDQAQALYAEALARHDPDMEVRDKFFLDSAWSTFRVMLTSEDGVTFCQHIKAGAPQIYLLGHPRFLFCQECAGILLGVDMCDGCDKPTPDLMEETGTAPPWEVRGTVIGPVTVVVRLCEACHSRTL